ncbi:hypothetical protein V8E51_002376 [Hyaloscypha variabilis]
MYQRVEGQPSVEHETRDNDDGVSPDGSFTRSLPADYWGSLDSPPESRTSRLSFPDTFESFDEAPQDGNPSQQKLGAKAQSDPVVERIDEPNPWTPGILARIPRLGFLAMVFNIMMTIVSIVVLVLSNNSQTDHWNKFFQPSVWLSATSTLANMSSTLALAQGLIIAFWRKAGKGATLAELHLYANGASLFTVLASVGRSFRSPGSFFITLACVLSTLSAFRGPIVQRASTVVSVFVPTTGNMTLYVAQMLRADTNPLGFVNGDEEDTVSYLSENFTSILKDYTARTDISIHAPYCGTTCDAIVQGFGFKPTCENGTFEFAFHNFTTFDNVTTVFESKVYYLAGSTLAENSPFTLNVTYLNDGISQDFDGISTKAWSNCTMVKAIVEYPVIISGDTITLQMNGTPNYLPNNEEDVPKQTTQSIEWGDSPADVITTSSVIGGFGFYLDSLFGSSSTLNFTVDANGNGEWNLVSTGMYANQYMDLGPNDWVMQASTSWNDSINDMLDTINQLTFRTAVQVGQQKPDPAFAQNVVYTGTELTTVYKSNYSLMAVAVAINFLGLLAILPVYYGWWELGRNTSLSPLETGLAFGAPLLRDLDGNATARQILERVGERRVKYGETFGSGREGEGFLIPRKGLRGRLQIVEEQRARSPESGDVFGVRR